MVAHSGRRSQGTFLPDAKGTPQASRDGRRRHRSVGGRAGGKLAAPHLTGRGLLEWWAVNAGLVAACPLFLSLSPPSPCPSLACVVIQFTSVQFSHSVVSDSLRPHESQHARPPGLSQTPGVYSNSCTLSRWCHPAISSSVIRFSSCPQSLPASGSFPVSQLFAWGGQSIGVSASASVLPMNTQDWSPLGWTGWSSLQSIIISVTQFLFKDLSPFCPPPSLCLKGIWPVYLQISKARFINV